MSASLNYIYMCISVFHSVTLSSVHCESRFTHGALWNIMSKCFQVKVHSKPFHGIIIKNVAVEETSPPVFLNTIKSEKDTPLCFPHNKIIMLWLQEPGGSRSFCCWSLLFVTSFSSLKSAAVRNSSFSILKAVKTTRKHSLCLQLCYYFCTLCRCT